MEGPDVPKYRVHRGQNNESERHLMSKPYNCDKCGDLCEIALMYSMRDDQGRKIEKTNEGKSDPLVCPSCQREWFEDHSR
jgi:predicted RNA-binding Zn-ribbon protein involved in translation (DUF1610 family)